MSKLNQIEKALKELGEAAFQKLADAYLHKKGYDQLNSLGSVTGADKVRKGTPDSLITLPNGKYVFAEYTTQQTDLYRKLKHDLDKCLDEKHTGIPRSKLAEVIFCYTTELDSNEIDGLRKQCQKNRVGFSQFGISRMAHDLLLKYPGIAREFLGVEVDTGQVLDLDEFVSAYNMHVLATPLDTAFHFRVDELKDVVKLLESSDLVIIGGRAGVGKSRFAIECCKEYAKAHADVKIKTIFNRGPDIFTDLQVHFAEPGHYLLLVDDANRINRFDYVLQLLHNQNQNRKLKLVATARDYAVAKVRESAQLYRGVEYRELSGFTNDEIKKLVEDECGIKNHLYLDRIADIAKGNSRLAIMAGKIASRENRLESIMDVSGLYDEYFSSIRKDIEDLGDSSVVAVAGLVAFFRFVDRVNQEMMKSIEMGFGFSEDSFWHYAKRLHETEILDLWENEVVRFSDQVLATYVFYLCFFKQRSLSFADLLMSYFPRHKEHLNESFYPVLNAFYSDQLMEVVRKDIDRVWDNYQTAGDSELILSFCEAFWFVKETDVLVYIKDSIRNLGAVAALRPSDTIKPDSSVHSPSILGVLKKFSQSDEGNVRIALTLIYDYLQKRPTDLPKVLYLHTEAFGFHHRSHLHGFYVQRAVVETLWQRTHDSADPWLSKLQFLVYGHYLQTRFHATESADRHAFNIIDFRLPPTPALQELRRRMWKNLFELYSVPEFQSQVLETLEQYSSSGSNVCVDEIVENDAAEIMPFVNTYLHPESYVVCVLVHSLLDLFEHHKVLIDQTLRSRFTNKAYELSQILFDDLIEKRTLQLSFEEYKKLKLTRIAEHSSSFTSVDYTEFIKNCAVIKNGLKGGRDEYQFQEGVREVLISLAQRDVTLYVRVLHEYLAMGDPLGLNPAPLVARLFEGLDPSQILSMLTLPALNSNALARLALHLKYAIRRRVPYPSRQKWLFAYYQTLPAGRVTKESAKQVYNLYKTSKRDEPPHHLDYLLKYWEIDQRLFIRITKVLLRKSKQDRLYGLCLSLLFNSNLEVNKRIIEIFPGHVDLVKKAFFCVLEVDPHADYDGTTISKMLDMDPNAVVDYIKWMYGKKEWLSKHDDSRDYSFLWRRDDYEEAMTRIMDCILAIELRKGLLYGSYLETWFEVREVADGKDVIGERQDKFIGNVIERQHHNSAAMKLMFLVIASFEPERRRKFLALYVEHNKNFGDFDILSLEPSSQSWSGSRVPVLSKSQEYYESLLPMFNKPDLLEHKQFIENRIISLEKQIEWEKKRDFMDD